MDSQPSGVRISQRAPRPAYAPIADRARLASSPMHVVRVVRVLLPVLIVAAIVGAGSSVLSARPDIEKAKRNVDTAWSSLSTGLDHRYLLLAAVDDQLRPVPGPVHSLVGSVDTALARWRDVRAHGGLATQVEAANDVEGLGRELIATAAASPRVHGNSSVLVALAKFLSDGSQRAATAFNANVTSYEHERRGPVRTVVASLLGDGTIPVLDTTSPPVSQSA